MAIVSDFTALIGGATWNQYDNFGKPAIVTYSFETTAMSYLAAAFPKAPATFQPLNESEKAVVRQALQDWSSISGLTFIETARHQGDMTFSFVDFTTMGIVDAAGYGYSPGYFIESVNGQSHVMSAVSLIRGDAFFDAADRSNPNFLAGLKHLALHEIGHTLGLKHPHLPRDHHVEVLNPVLDHGNSTVMSYKPPFASQLGPLDIAAAQYLYGPASGQGTQFSSWSFDPVTERFTASGTTAGEWLRGTGTDDVIHGMGGRDLIYTAQGDDIIYAAGGAVEVNADIGFDVVYTGLSVSGMSAITAHGTGVAVTAGAVQQIYYGVEQLRFDNGFADLTRGAFASQPALNQTADIYAKIVRVGAAPMATENAAIDIALGQLSAQSYAQALIAGAAQNASVPALIVYKAMMDGAPANDHLTSLSAFAWNQVYSPNYQATANPRLGAYEALGLAFSDLSPALKARAGESDAAFVAGVYQSAFSRAATAAQTDHFLGQLNFFEQLYLRAGIAAAEADIKARGAVFGQMLGHAAQEPGNGLKIAAEATLIGFVSSSESSLGVF